jgi:hypothetical protein
MKFTGEKVFDIEGDKTAKKATTKEYQFKANPDVNIDMSKFSISNLDKMMYDTYGRAEQTMTNVGSSGVGSSKYDKGVTLGQIDQLEAFRASQQGLGAKTFNTIVGGLSSGAVGALKGFSAMADAGMQLVGAMEDFDKSALTELLQNTQDLINENTPLYRKNRDKTFDFGDSSFYFEILKGGLDSAVAFGIPGGVYGRAASALFKGLGKASIAGKRLDVLTRFYGSKVAMPNFAQSGTQLTGAFLSNYAEGTIMGLESYDSEKEKLMIVGERNARERKAKELNISPEEVELTEKDYNDIEDYSIKEAAKAGHFMRDWNHMLLFSNMHQMKAMAGVKQWIKGGGSTTARQMQSKIYKPTEWGFWKDQLIGAPVEAAEEIIQNVIQMEGRYRADTRAMQKGLSFKAEELESSELDFNRRVLEFATSDQALLEGLMGAVGGPIQYAVTSAPFQKAQRKEANTRYATQQAIIGKNKEFIENKLKQSITAEQLASDFEAYRDEYLGRDLSKDTPEQKAKDTEAFTKLLENTPLDTLIQENIFNGTLEDLEAQLTEAINKEVTTEEEKENVEFANKALTRMRELETRFQTYSKYINGSDIFAADLRGERLAQISSDLTESFANREAKLTTDINAFIEDHFTKLYGSNYKTQDVQFSSHFELVRTNDKDEVIEDSKKEVNSVSDIINGVKEGYSFRYTNLAKGDSKNVDFIDSINKTYKNRILLDETNKLITKNILFSNEAKKLEYQSLYAQFKDALESVDENEVHEMGVVKTNLENLLKNKRFTSKEKDADNNPIPKYTQLQTLIKSTIEDIDKKIQFIENNERNLESEKANEVKQTSKADEAAARTTPKDTATTTTIDDIIGEQDGDPIEDEIVGDEVPANQGLAAAMENTAISGKHTFPPLGKFNQELLNLGPIEERTEAQKKYKFVNPDTGKAEEIHTARVIAQDEKNDIIQVSFASNPDKFYDFDTQDGENSRLIGTEKEYKALQANPKTETTPVTDGTQTSETRTSQESDIAKNQILNDKKVDGINNVEPVITDANAALKSMQNQIALAKDLESAENGVDVIVNPTTGEKESANVKVLDFNFSIDKDSPYNAFMNNKENKEGVVVKMVVEVFPKNAKALFPASETEVLQAIEIFNKLKAAGVKSLKDKQTVIDEAEYDILMNYLPIRFAVKDKPAIFSWMHVKNKKSKRQQKIAERNLREDVINGALSGTSVERVIKGQGPGRLNVLPNGPAKVIEFFESTNEQGDRQVDTVKLEKAVMHTSIGGALVAINEKDKNTFQEVFLSHTDAEGASHGWEGVITLAVPTLSGKLFPIKLNTLNHSLESASVVAEILREMAKPITKGEANIGDMPISKALPNVYQWLKTNMPTIFYQGDNIKVKEVLSDLVYYGKSSEDKYGRLTIKNGVITIGDGSNENFSENKKPLTFTYNSLLNQDSFDKLIQFITEVKPYNVNVKKIKNGTKAARIAYMKHIFSNFMETTVDLNNAFVKDYNGNPNISRLQRLNNGHIYISSLPIGETAETGTITEVETEQPTTAGVIVTEQSETDKLLKRPDNKGKVTVANQPATKTTEPSLNAVQTSSNIKPVVSAEKQVESQVKPLDSSEEKTNLQKEKTAEEMQKNNIEEIENCPLGAKPSTPEVKPKLKLASTLKLKK